MINWQKTKYGYRFTVSGTTTLDEMAEWAQDIKESISREDSEFFVLADMQDFAIFSPECKAALEELERFGLQRGLKRSVVIVKDDLTASQIKLVAKKTGVYAWERYIDASTNPGWESIAMDWLLNGTDPDIKTEEEKSVFDQ